MTLGSPFDPPRSLPQSELSGRALILKRVARPGTALIITGSIAASIDVVFLVSSLIALASSTSNWNNQLRDQVLTWGFLAVVHTLISIGGAKLAFLESLKLAKLGAILSCIPLISPFVWVGIPFGLWSIWLLHKPEIAAAFDLNAETV